MNKYILLSSIYIAHYVGRDSRFVRSHLKSFEACILLVELLVFLVHINNVLELASNFNGVM